MARLVPQDAHAPLLVAPFDLEHLRLLELFEPRVREVERDGDGRGAVRRKPLVGEVEVEREIQAARVEFLPQPGGPIRQRPLD